MRSSTVFSALRRWLAKDEDLDNSITRRRKRVSGVQPPCMDVCHPLRGVAGVCPLGSRRSQAPTADYGSSWESRACSAPPPCIHEISPKKELDQFGQERSGGAERSLI